MLSCLAEEQIMKKIIEKLIQELTNPQHASNQPVSQGSCSKSSEDTQPELHKLFRSIDFEGTL